MSFQNAEAAIRWAEGRLSRSTVKCSLASLQKSGSFGSGDLSPSDLDDMAMTVTSLCNQIDKPKGLALLAVYGVGTAHDWILSDMMVLHVRNMMGDQKIELTQKQMKSMMLVCVMDERQLALGGKVTKLKDIYSLCNLNYYKYHQFGVAEFRSLSQTMLRNWLDDAARQLELELDAINMLSR